MRYLLKGLLFLEALILFGPTLLVWVAGFLMYSVLLVSGDITPANYLLFILLPGYAVLALVWLVFQHTKYSIREIPLLVSGGLGIGLLLAIFMIYAVLNGLMANANNPLNVLATVGVAPLIGPFLLLTHLLALMYFRNKSSDSQPDPDVVNRQSSQG